MFSRIDLKERYKNISSDEIKWSHFNDLNMVKLLGMRKDHHPVEIEFFDSQIQQSITIKLFKNKKSIGHIVSTKFNPFDMTTYNKKVKI